VSYRHGGVPEAVADRITGLLSPEGDRAQLSSDLGALLADPARAGVMGAAGYRRAAALFDLGTQNARLEEIYDQVAESADPGCGPALRSSRSGAAASPAMMVSPLEST
jgi:glycosyltransferase involved in cell wall biosynthesis